MKCVVPSLLLCTFSLLPAVCATAQTAPQTTPQTGAQGTVQPISPAEAKSLYQGTQGVATAHTLTPMATPELSPQLLELVKLETEFEKSVAKGGGTAFASWFADDAVTLNNGLPAVMGQKAIADHAVWNPKDYQLSWFIQGAQMGPSGDTAFTWGHYDASGNDLRTGKPFTFSGRYTTFWKKVGGKWKVALDASSNEPPDPGSPSAPPACTQAQPR